MWASPSTSANIIIPMTPIIPTVSRCGALSVKSRGLSSMSPRGNICINGCWCLGILLLTFLVQCSKAAPTTVTAAVTECKRLMRAGQYLSARDLLTEAQRLAKDEADRAILDLQSGECWLTELNYPEATTAFSKVANAAGLPVSTRMEGVLGLSRVQQAQGQQEAARAELRKVLNWPDLTISQKPKIHILIMESLVTEHKNAEARAEFRSVFDDPNTSDLEKTAGLYYFEIAYMRDEKYEEGQTVIQHMLEQPGLGTEARLRLCRTGADLAIYGSPHRIDARTWFEKIIALPDVDDETKALTHGRIAELLADNGNLNDAIAEYQKAFRLTEITSIAARSAHLGLAKLLISAGQVDEAIAHFQKVVGARDDPILQITAFQGVAQGYSIKQDWPQAIASLTAALKIPTSDQYSTKHLLESLGRVYEKQKDYKQAAASFLSITRLGDLNSFEKFEAYLNAARNTRKAGHHDETKAYLLTALALPNVPDSMREEARASITEQVTHLP